MRTVLATSAAALLLLGGCGAADKIDAFGKEVRACRDALAKAVENARDTAADAVEKGRSVDDAIAGANPPECRNIDDNLTSGLRKELADRIRGQ
ncbi:MAG: hypothetical protein ACT4QF_01170 [Sporichthyaceae bacterium]